MIERVLRFSITHRAAGGAGGRGDRGVRCPLAAATADRRCPGHHQQPGADQHRWLPALSPFEIEKKSPCRSRRHWPASRACNHPLAFAQRVLAGHGGLSTTRSTSTSPAQQVTQRLSQAKQNLPAGAEPKMGAVSTGLGEIYMWTVEYEHPGGKGADVKDGEPGWQSDGSYLTPEGLQAAQGFRAGDAICARCRTGSSGPQLKGVHGVADVDAIGGYEQQYQVQPDPQKLLSVGPLVRRCHQGAGAQQLWHRRRLHRAQRRGLSSCARMAGSRTPKTSAMSCCRPSARRADLVKDVAEVGIGRELRTGSASENGHEVVVGTAMMLKGGNSRTVAAAVDAKMTEINRALPPDIAVKTVLNRTKLVDATIATVEKEPRRGALLVIAVLFLLLGNFRAALITALVIPITMLMTATGMVRTGICANLMSLGALDFGLIVDGAVIIAENCLRRLAERQHALSSAC